jgi:hypothetical protein
LKHGNVSRWHKSSFGVSKAGFEVALETFCHTSDAISLKSEGAIVSIAPKATQRRKEQFQTNLNNTILMLETFSGEVGIWCG